MPSDLWERRTRVTVAAILMAPLVLAACQDDTGERRATRPSMDVTPTSASESRDAAVATTIIERRAETEAPPPSGVVDGEQICALLVDADLAALGQGFRPEAGPGRCAWTDPGGSRSLTIASTMLVVPPGVAVQQYLKGIGTEPLDAFDDIGDAAVLMATSARRTSLVVFTDDVRLDLDVPSGREITTTLAKVAVDRLGPRTPAPAAAP